MLFIQKFILGFLPDASKVVMDEDANVIDLDTVIKNRLVEDFIGWDIVFKEDLCGINDYLGNEILPCEYESFTLPEDDRSLIIVVKGGKYGLINIKSKESVLPTKNLHLEWLNQNRFLVQKTKAEAAIFVDRDNNEIFRLYLDDKFLTQDEILNKAIEDMIERFRNSPLDKLDEDDYIEPSQIYKDNEFESESEKTKNSSFLDIGFIIIITFIVLIKLFLS